MDTPSPSWQAEHSLLPVRVSPCYAGVMSWAVQTQAAEQLVVMNEP